MEYVSMGRILNSILMLALTIIAINQGLSVVGLAYIYFGVGVFCLFYSLLIYILKLGMIKPDFDWLFLKPTINAALPFFLSALVDTIAFKVDIVMLSSMKGDIVVGWYSAAYRLLEVMMFVPGTFGGSIYPVFSKFYVSSHESFKLAYKKSFEYLCIIALPVSVGTTILADKIISIIYADNYEPSINVLRILIWTVPVIFLSYFMGTMLASINKQELAAKINFFNMLLNISANLILIPRYSLDGAAIATVITSSASLLLCFHFISKFVYRFPLFWFALKLAIANTMMGLFTLYFMDINIILLVSLSAVIYIAMLILLNIFSNEDRIIVQRIIHRNKRGQ
jgi:O-antigen/teichoic acid export membrane protein